MDAKGILDNIKKIKSIDKDKYLLDKSKGTITSTLIGGGLGIIIAYNRKKSILLGAVVGGAIAGLLSNYIVNK